MVFEGIYYSGLDSERVVTHVSVDDAGHLHLAGIAIPSIRFSDLQISPRVGNSMRYLHLPDGACIETRCNDEVDRLVSHWKAPASGRLHRLERSTRITLFAVVFLVVGGYVLVTRGVPALSAMIVDALPTSLDDRLGGEVLEQLDELVFAETKIDEDRQDALRELFYSLVSDEERNYRLQFRSSEFIGANAFALPDAQIVFTDQLIELTDDDQMLASIMLHEIGHVKERHSMQAVVRQAGISILIVTLTGDVNTAATTLLVLFPSFLIQSQYSQGLEWAADSYALEQMLARGMDTNAFADMMERLVASGQPEDEKDAESEVVEDGEEGGLMDYFSSHPATLKRIERFRDAAR